MICGIRGANTVWLLQFITNTMLIVNTGPHDGTYSLLHHSFKHFKITVKPDVLVIATLQTSASASNFLRFTAATVAQEAREGWSWSKATLRPLPTYCIVEQNNGMAGRVQIVSCISHNNLRKMKSVRSLSFASSLWALQQFFHPFWNKERKDGRCLVKR